MSAGTPAASLSVIEDSMTVKRLWRNTQAAMKYWAATEDPARPTLDDLRQWGISVDTLRGWYVRDVLALEEFEALVGLLLGLW